MSSQKVLHIVRRFGPVGGMEKYVWELVHELDSLGYQITVLCEKAYTDVKSPGIQVFELGVISEKPRWISMLRFSRRVSRWVNNQPQSEWIIHSHERTAVHKVTTFHGPPFATIKEKSWHKKLSFRVWTWLALENRELCAPQVKAILPNSYIIRDLLLQYYPCSKNRIMEPVYPGVSNQNQKYFSPAPEKGGKIVFIGKEWKRKGLEKACRIVSLMKKKRPLLEFWIVGPDPETVKHLFSGWQGGYRLLGWQNNGDFLSGVSLLIHPATNEPYGMVVAEASAAGIPVIVSSKSGIAPLVKKTSGVVLPVEDSDEVWAEQCEIILTGAKAAQSIGCSWKETALQTKACYQKILK